MPADAAKKLIYVVNVVSEADTQHFVHVLRLLSVLRQRGWEVALLSEKGGTRRRRIGDHDVTYLSDRRPWMRLPRLVAQLVRLRVRGYRLVFVRISVPTAIVAGLIGRIIGIRLIYWQSGTTHDFDREASRWRWRWRRMQMRWLVRIADRFATGPETMIGYYKRTLGVPSAKLLLLYNDVDMARFAPPAGEREGDAVRVLFVHNMSPVRRTTWYFPAIVAALNCAARSVPIRLDIVGDGAERTAIEREVGRADPGVAVRMHGALPNRLLPPLYAGADIFVMPTYREGMPRSMMEAMAAGLAAVATDAGGTRDLVGPLQGGFVVSRDDPEAFASALLRLALDPDVRRALACENLASARRFSTEAVAAMYDERLSSLLP